MAKQNQGQFKHINRLRLIGVVTWTVLISLSLVWNIYTEHQQIRELATKEARAHFNKDKALRFWASSHGGVYVPTDEHTPPNPNLSHIPDRDITTPSGKQLTLMNPAYMIRQIMSEYAQLYGVQGMITTFPDKLFNPINAPDEWSKRALEAFSRGETEVLEFTDIDGQPYLRLMRPLVIQDTCLKCHGMQGYKVGDLRGGVGVSIPMADYLKSESDNNRVLVLFHVAIWFVVVALILAFTRQIQLRIAERIELESSLRQSQKMEALGNLAGGIAHEVNNMLLPIISLSQMAAKEMPDGSRQRLRLEKISEAGEKAKKIVSDVLMFSHRQDGAIAKELVDIASIVRDAVGLLETTLPSTIKITENLDPNTGKVCADASQISTVLINLCGNAADAMDGSVGELNITLSAAEVAEPLAETVPNLRTGTYAKLTVSDTGGGMDPKTLDHLFDPFFTTKEVGKGTGLGLAIVHGILVNHGGAISVSSKHGKGSTFEIYLPLADEGVDVAD